jgi:phosphate/sulfate permease
MRDYQKQLIVLFIACITAAVTWVIIDRKIIPGEYAKMMWFVFAPVTAARVSVSLQNMFGLPLFLRKFFMGAVVVLGWYCPMALIAMRKITLSKRHKILCVVGFILIWILPLVGYIAAKSE